MTAQAAMPFATPKPTPARNGSARRALHRRFANRLVVRDDFNRRIVSYQANKTQPGLRWFKYRTLHLLGQSRSPNQL